MKDKARKPTTTPGSEPPPAEVLELPERWSVQRKTELVVRLVRGEPLDAVPREGVAQGTARPSDAFGCSSRGASGVAMIMPRTRLHSGARIDDRHGSHTLTSPAGVQETG